MNTSSFYNPPLILASGSPRRRSLLEQAGLNFTVIPGNFDEKSVEITTPGNYVQILARSKAMNIAKHYPQNWIIGADTIVLINGKILGKPESTARARHMLRLLSGATHQVYTGYCICCKAKKRTFSDNVITDVLFKHLTDDEIEWYINTDEPFDKAGGYALQGLGTFMIKSINGSYTNVVGLPICEVIDFLTKEKLLSGFRT
jgi:septum formation protein